MKIWCFYVYWQDLPKSGKLSVNRFIWSVNVSDNKIHQNTTNSYFCWRFGLYHRPSSENEADTSSSSYWHDENLNLTCQESGHVHDRVHGFERTDFSGYYWDSNYLPCRCIWPPWSTWQDGLARCQSLSPWTSWTCDSAGLRGQLERICWSLLSWHALTSCECRIGLWFRFCPVVLKTPSFL